MFFILNINFYLIKTILIPKHHITSHQTSVSAHLQYINFFVYYPNWGFDNDAYFQWIWGWGKFS